MKKILCFLCCFLFLLSCGTAEKKTTPKKTPVKQENVSDKKKDADDGITENGIHNLPNGDRYIGGFKNHKKFGEGEYIYANGDRYKGFFANGHYNGQGELTLKDGTKYISHRSGKSKCPARGADRP